MKFMTYNILNGAPDRFDAVLSVVRDESPDILSVNEANTFWENGRKQIRDMMGICGFSDVFPVLSDVSPYHVVLFSKIPLKKTVKIQGLKRACGMVIVDTVAGELSVAGGHLMPYVEKGRLSEIGAIMQSQKPYERRIIMGDMNSLSSDDGYPQSLLETFSSHQKDKFTDGVRIRFDVTDMIKHNGYLDSAVLMKKNAVRTAPTKLNENDAHNNMRLDYIFVSLNLKQSVREYRVIKNTATHTASDHYPVCVNLDV